MVKIWHRKKIHPTTRPMTEISCPTPSLSPPPHQNPIFPLRRLTEHREISRESSHSKDFPAFSRFDRFYVDFERENSKTGFGAISVHMVSGRFHGTQLSSMRVFIFFMWILRGKISKTKTFRVGWVRRRAACGTADWFQIHVIFNAF